jgi:hypothetical protein
MIFGQHFPELIARGFLIRSFRSWKAWPFAQLLLVPVCLVANAAQVSAQASGADARDGARIGGRHMPDPHAFRTGRYDAPPTESTTHDFDSLLGNWQFTAESKVPGTPATYTGRWTCERIGDGALVEDDCKAHDDGGRRVYLGVTFAPSTRRPKRGPRRSFRSRRSRVVDLRQVPPGHSEPPDDRRTRCTKVGSTTPSQPAPVRTSTVRARSLQLEHGPLDRRREKMDD